MFFGKLTLCDSIGHEYSCIFHWISWRCDWTCIEFIWVTLNWFRSHISHARNWLIQFGTCEIWLLNQALGTSHLNWIYWIRRRKRSCIMGKLKRVNWLNETKISLHYKLGRLSFKMSKNKTSFCFVVPMSSIMGIICVLLLFISSGLKLCHYFRYRLITVPWWCQRNRCQF